MAAKDKLKITFISMEGNASYWFQFWKQKTKNQSWESFTEALIRRFGGRDRSSVFERLAKVKQQGSMEEYIQKFELLVSQAPNLTEEQLMGYFLAGLQPKIRHQIRPHDPKELTRAMDIALDLEDMSNFDRGGVQSYRSSHVRYTGGSGVTARLENYKGVSKTGQSSIGSNGRKESFNATRDTKSSAYGREGMKSSGAKTLPYPEYVKRKDEGRCFHCEGPYSHEHKCPDKNLRVVICWEEEELEEETQIQGEIEEEAVRWETESQNMKENPQMSLSELSAGGLTQPHTMKMQGEIRGRKVLILVDSGASHNFISTDLVKELRLDMEDTLAYSVKLGDGFRRGTRG